MAATASAASALRFQQYLQGNGAAAAAIANAEPGTKAQLQAQDAQHVVLANSAAVLGPAPSARQASIRA